MYHSVLSPFNEGWCCVVQQVSCFHTKQQSSESFGCTYQFPVEANVELTAVTGYSKSYVVIYPMKSTEVQTLGVL